MHKNVLALILSVTMLFSSATTVFASEPINEASTQTVSQQEDHGHAEELPTASEEESDRLTELPEQAEPPEAPEIELPAPDPIDPPIVDSGIPPGISDVELPPSAEEIPAYTIVELRTGESIVISQHKTGQNHVEQQASQWNKTVYKSETLYAFGVIYARLP